MSMPSIYPLSYTGSADRDGSKCHPASPTHERDTVLTCYMWQVGHFCGNDRATQESEWDRSSWVHLMCCFIFSTDRHSTAVWPKRVAGTEVQTEPINQKTKWRSYPEKQHGQLFDITDQLQLQWRLVWEVFNQDGQHVCANCRGKSQRVAWFPS